MTALDSGDFSAVKALPVEQRKALVQTSEAAIAFTCLAIAQASTKYCELLEKPAQDNCAEQSRIVGALKSVPPNAVKSRLFSLMCSHGEHGKADCDKLEQAIMSGDAARCATLPNDVPFNFCAALATNDPEKCPQTDPALRDVCAAFVTEDASRCPKDAGDCVKIVGDLRVVKTEGLDSANLSNPAMAGSKGIKGCAPLIAAVTDRCSGPAPFTAQSPSAGDAEATPNPRESPAAAPDSP